MRNRHLFVPMLAALAVFATACSDDTAEPDAPATVDEVDAGPNDADPADAAVTRVVRCDVVETTGDEALDEALAAAGLGVCDGTDLSDTTAVPELAVLEGAAPPTELTAIDVVEGSGDAVAACNNPLAGCDTVMTDYWGVSYALGEVFDSSWARGAVAEFGLHQVIPGWGQGFAGLMPGGRRILVIPPELAYGEQPPPGGDIAANDTLVFVVDLRDFVPAGDAAN